MRLAAFLRRRPLLLQRRIPVGAAHLHRSVATGKGEDSRRVQFAAGSAILGGKSKGSSKSFYDPGCSGGSPRKFEPTKAIFWA